MIWVARADVRVVVRQHRSPVVFVEWGLVISRLAAVVRLVGLIEVRIVMRLGIDGVAPEVVDGLLPIL